MGTLTAVNIWDPGQWADVDGLWLLIAVIVGTLVLAAAKLAGPDWDDWLDERLGRGSIRDDWPFRRRPDDP
ncbi:MAG TPA: hypothetical protein VJ804_09390 [Acidimicrobiales bacterium]|nr:hypothetical protein [Acidimicrobiales bacterium]